MNSPGRSVHKKVKVTPAQRAKAESAIDDFTNQINAALTARMVTKQTKVSAKS